MSHEKDLIRYLETLLGESLELEEIKGLGERNNNYLVLTDSQKFVCRHSPENKEYIRYEEAALNLLEIKEIDFAPRSIYRDEGIHLISYEGEENILVDQMSESQLEELVDKIARIHKIKPHDVSDYSGQNGLRGEITLDENLNLFRKSTEDFVQNFWDSSLFQSVNRRFEIVEEKIKNIDISNEGLVHGDLRKNFREGDQIYLIDWELSKIVENPEKELGYMFAHSNLNQEKRKTVINRYSCKTNLEPKKLMRITDLFEEFIILHEIRMASKIQQERGENKGHSERMEKWISRAENRLNIELR